jgi:murein DD-endopeptidase MepM/ murein hydrolase activator NlpD
LRKRYYIIFVSRDDEGRLRKIPVPLHYAYIFVAAALVGLFTITGLTGSYGRMLLKTARFNQVRTERETLRKDYAQLEQVAKEKDVQAASLGSLASEVSALYGLGSRHSKESSSTIARVVADNPPDSMSTEQYHQTLAQLLDLRYTAMSGQIARRLDYTNHFPLGSISIGAIANAPTLWPVQGKVTSSFGERQDPFNDEGAFHSGIDIATTYGDAVRVTADGTVLKAGMGNGYGREIIIDHGQGVETLYAHLSGFAVTAGQEVHRGDVIGFVGSSGRSTGPHLHYEVRINNTPVNPHQYLRFSSSQYASAGQDVSPLTPRPTATPVALGHK